MQVIMKCSSKNYPFEKIKTRFILMPIDSKENFVCKYFDTYNVFSDIIINDKETRVPLLIIK